MSQSSYLNPDQDLTIPMLVGMSILVMSIFIDMSSEPIQIENGASET